jgi:hypothetical protein
LSVLLLKFEDANMLIDRRCIARTKVVQPAKIIVKGGDDTYNCTVDNLNTLGACLSFNPGAIEALPHSFDLTFDNCRSFWSCRVIWRNKNCARVGVAWKIG